MALIAKNQSANFQPTPLGMQQACCAFVEDVGLQPNMNGDPVQKCIILWELAEKMTDNRPFMISKNYTISLNEKANLRKDLESWRGRPFTAEELDGFDLEKLKGINCLLNIVEATSKQGKKYAKIASITPLMKGMEKIAVQATEPPQWVAKLREVAMHDEPVVTPVAKVAMAAQGGAADDAEIPF